MRVIMLARPGAEQGGDIVALKGYVAALRRAGVYVEIRDANAPGTLNGDFAHLWGACAPDWGLPAAREVKVQGSRLIVTPFWWSRAERQAFYEQPGDDVRPGYTPEVAETLKLADVLFPVTVSEAVQCWKLSPGQAVFVVPMGFDRPPVEPAEPQDYVLSIGRVEAHKNQASLARACAAIDKRLMLIGSIDEKYRKFVEAQGADITWLDRVSEAGKWQALQHARVHALPSFFENPGLVHGEAMMLGIPAVMGFRGCEPEFYGSRGTYCDPMRVASIAGAVATAWNAPREPVDDLPSWDDAAGLAIRWMEAAL